MTTSELRKQLEELQKELIKENAQVASGTAPKNPGSVRAIKKNIARRLTLIHEKEGDKKQ